MTTSNAVYNALNNIPFGKYITLAEGSDMNNFKNSNYIYAQQQTFIIRTFVNRPTFTEAGEMAMFNINLGNTGDYLMQIYIAKSDNTFSISVRVFGSSGWTGWSRII